MGTTLAVVGGLLIGIFLPPYLEARGWGMWSALGIAMLLGGVRGALWGLAFP